MVLTSYRHSLSQFRIPLNSCATAFDHDFLIQTISNHWFIWLSDISIKQLTNTLYLLKLLCSSVKNCSVTKVNKIHKIVSHRCLKVSQTTSVAQEFALWVLNEEIPCSIPDRINLEGSFLNWFWILLQMNSIALVLIVRGNSLVWAKELDVIIWYIIILRKKILASMLWGQWLNLLICIF